MTKSSRRLTPSWRWADGSFDRCKILEGPDGWQIDGRHDDLHYQIATDAAFRCNRLWTLAVAGRQTLDLTLTRDASGWRNGKGDLLPESAAALDLDLSWTALTNSFPIRRLIKEGRDRGDFDVLWVQSPDSAPKIARQSYVRDGEVWHYHSHTSGFSAVLEVDNDALVTNYPGVCKQLGNSA